MTSFTWHLKNDPSKLKIVKCAFVGLTHTNSIPKVSSKQFRVNISVYKIISQFFLCLFSTALLHQPAYAQNNTPYSPAKHVVTRSYEMTVRMSQSCSQASSDVSNKFNTELARFVSANEPFMKQLKQSPYYPEVEKNLRYDPAKEVHSKDELASVCGYYANILGAMTDTPEGRAEVEKMTKIISTQ